MTRLFFPAPRDLIPEVKLDWMTTPSGHSSEHVSAGASLVYMTTLLLRKHVGHFTENKKQRSGEEEDVCGSE